MYKRIILFSFIISVFFCSCKQDKASDFSKSAEAQMRAFHGASYFPTQLLDIQNDYIFTDSLGSEYICSHGFGFGLDSSNLDQKFGELSQTIMLNDYNAKLVLTKEGNKEFLRANLFYKPPCSSQAGIDGEFTIGEEGVSFPDYEFAENWKTAKYYESRIINGLSFSKIRCGKGRLKPRNEENSQASTYEICIQKERGIVSFSCRNDIYTLLRIDKSN